MTEEIWRAVSAERASLVRLLEPLPAEAWRHPSLCERWQVRDVVAHLILSADARLATVLLELIRARGDLHRLIADTALRHAAARTDAELLTELRATIPFHTTMIGTTPADRLTDLLVHAQDIAVPLGIPHPAPAPATRIALDHTWSRTRPYRARERFPTHTLIASDTEWQAGEGRTILRAPATHLLLTLTGRTRLPATE